MNDVVEIKIEKVLKPFPDSKTWKDGKKRGKIIDSDGIKYQVAETMLRQFNDGDVCKVEVKKFGDKDNPGLEVVKRIGDPGAASLPPKQFTRAAANPQDSDRMGTMGQVNALLNGWAQGRSLDEILQTPNDKYRLLIDKMNAVLLSTRLHGAQVQRDDGMDDEITI